MKLTNPFRVFVEKLLGKLLPARPPYDPPTRKEAPEDTVSVPPAADRFDVKVLMSYEPEVVVRLPTTDTLPASVTVVEAPGLIWRLPKVIAAVGVIVAVPVNAALLVAFSVKAVVAAVRLPPKFTFVPAIVVNTGALAPPNDNPPLKLIVPAVVAF